MKILSFDSYIKDESEFNSLRKEDLELQIELKIVSSKKRIIEYTNALKKEIIGSSSIDALMSSIREIEKIEQDIVTLKNLSKSLFS